MTFYSFVMKYKQNNQVAGTCPGFKSFKHSHMKNLSIT